jgi:hypothetical protein
MSEDAKTYAENPETGNDPNSLSGYGGAVEPTRIHFDVDRDNPEDALKDARRLLDRIEEYGVDPDAVRIYYSGSKGFHVEIPGECFGGFEASVDAPEKVKVMAYEIAGDVDLDVSVYERIRLWRDPNTINGKSGLYKVPLSYEEFTSLTVDQIRDLARAPREVEYAEPQVCPELVELKGIEVTSRKGRTVLSDGQIEALAAAVEKVLPRAGGYGVKRALAIWGVDRLGKERCRAWLRITLQRMGVYDADNHQKLDALVDSAGEKLLNKDVSVPMLGGDNEIEKVTPGLLAALEGVLEPKRGRWPELDGKALYGLSGDIVGAIEPYTEADPTAVLINILVGFGNAVGRGSYVMAGGGRHHLNLFAGIVGDTSKGRKGTSWELPYQLLSEADPEWANERVKSGLSSGEGLINAVRDPIRAPGKDGEPTIVDVGVQDKRLLAMEGEFAAVLQAMTRSGNTVSANIRNAWDGKRLETLVKHSPLKATNAHISIIGHITKTELLRLLSGTESANGFANRFLWGMSRRSKLLPFGGEFHKVHTAPLVGALKDAIEFGRDAGEIVWGASAKEIWCAVYGEVSEGKPGLLGAVTSRAEAQVVRLAALYAVLDKSQCIESDHLLAALAVWRYAEDSAAYIFGDSLGDPLADQLLRALKNNPAGLTRTEMHNLVGRNKDKAALDGALGVLLESGRAAPTTEQTTGRNVERWTA